MEAKRSYLAEAAPGSFDVYDLKVVMEATLYGMPHWSISAGLSAQASTPAFTRPRSTTALVDTRDITLTLAYELQQGPGGQIADVAVQEVKDDPALNLLGVDDVTERQEISFGRPQLPTLSFDAVYTDTRIPRGVVILGGTASDYPFDPIVTRVVTDYVYDASEPAYAFEQWFPSQPVKINRLGSYVGDGDKNEGMLVLYPAQFMAVEQGVGVLRAFDQLHLRIYYEQPGDSDVMAPVIQRVEAIPGPSQVEIVLEVIDPDPGVGTVSGVDQVWLTWSLDNVNWSDLLVPHTGGDTWSTTVPLPDGATGAQLTFVVQAVDEAGNVAYSANKGKSYSGAESTLYLPLILR